ncbi:hypothetical protein EDC94DRAFT_584263 [Helicostylum pulchrum]|nr:hypothetical protein EDC94DRAFT_584263 [Helicostylum pulchrum]
MSTSIFFPKIKEFIKREARIMTKVLSCYIIVSPTPGSLWLPMEKYITENFLHFDPVLFLEKTTENLMRETAQDNFERVIDSLSSDTKQSYDPVHCCKNVQKNNYEVFYVQIVLLTMSTKFEDISDEKRGSRRILRKKFKRTNSFNDDTLEDKLKDINNINCRRSEGQMITVYRKRLSAITGKANTEMDSLVKIWGEVFETMFPNCQQIHWGELKAHNNDLKD